jgi:hypothetical protein
MNEYRLPGDAVNENLLTNVKWDLALVLARTQREARLTSEFA